VTVAPPPPWSAPLRFAAAAGWRTGASGTIRSVRLADGRFVRFRGPESAAWTATAAVRYRNPPGEDPPNETIGRLRGNTVVVWAVIEPGSQYGPAPVRLDLRRARRNACCEGATPGYPYDLELAGPVRSRRYFLIVRIFFGSRPTPALRALAQRALDRLRLPS
jgi:hypothetical protein